LGRENKKFVYQLVKPGARAREYEDAIRWLEQAGLIYRIQLCKVPKLPLSAYDDLSAYKIYVFDVGILRKQSKLDPIAFTEGNRLFVEFKGALLENYILQSLIPQFEVVPRYWTSGNEAEVDFIVQSKNDIIPIEVKSDENVRSRSLSLYVKKYNPKLAIRYSLKNLSYRDGLLNIPHFMADYTQILLELIDVENDNQN
jgi:predicted AAA+ superfamily ATPase